MNKGIDIDIEQIKSLDDTVVVEHNVSWSPRLLEDAESQLSTYIVAGTAIICFC